MFLQPHHFQQETRYLERLVDARARCVTPFAWGFNELQLDDGLLALGKLGIARASGMLPDGTPFAMPHIDPLPAPLEIADEVKNELICLALPLQREGLNEFDFGNGAATDEMSRFEAVQEDARDNTDAAEEPVTIQTGRVRMRFVRSKEARDAFALLGVGLVLERRSDGQIVLDRSYIAPQTTIDASRQLSASAELLHGLVQQRAQALAARMGQLEPRRLGARRLPDAADAQPKRAGVRAARGDAERASARAPSRLPAAGRRPCHAWQAPRAARPASRRTGTTTCAAASRRCSTSCAACCRPCSTRRSCRSIWSIASMACAPRWSPTSSCCATPASCSRSTPQMPAEQLRQRFPAQTKMGPVDRIRDLVNLQLPGIGLRPLPVAPRQLPFHAGFFYFELDRGSELWKQVEKNGNVRDARGGRLPRARARAVGDTELNRARTTRLDHDRAQQRRSVRRDPVPAAPS